TSVITPAFGTGSGSGKQTRPCAWSSRISRTQSISAVRTLGSWCTACRAPSGSLSARLIDVRTLVRGVLRNLRWLAATVTIVVWLPAHAEDRDDADVLAESAAREAIWLSSSVDALDSEDLDFLRRVVGDARM